jgi:hypothetical protein
MKSRIALVLVMATLIVAFFVLDLSRFLDFEYLRAQREGLAALVKERFVPHAGDEVRIVVLNGVGRPGVGEEVARILVPEGYRLMSTGNANTFDVKVTKIISSSGGSGRGDLASRVLVPPTRPRRTARRRG